MSGGRADGDGLAVCSATCYPRRSGPGYPCTRFHDLRHTFASLTRGAGYTAFEVSRWMSHASMSTTTDIYGHLMPTDLSAQIDWFEAYVASS